MFVCGTCDLRDILNKLQPIVTLVAQFHTPSSNNEKKQIPAYNGRSLMQPGNEAHQYILLLARLCLRWYSMCYCLLSLLHDVPENKMSETSCKYDRRDDRLLPQQRFDQVRTFNKDTTPKILLLKVILKFIYGKFYRNYYSLRSKINQFLESSKIKLSLSLTNFIEKNYIVYNTK